MVAALVLSGAAAGCARSDSHPARSSLAITDVSAAAASDVPTTPPPIPQVSIPPTTAPSTTTLLQPTPMPVLSADQLAALESELDQIDAILAEQFKAAGMTYVKRLTAEERAERDRRIAEVKAAQKVKALQEQFPDLGISMNETPF